MAIENEIVRFIAEMELDPQDQAKFVEGLRQAEEQCESLRKQSIADAIATAEQAKLILDELFERKNSLEINTVDINVEINNLMSKVRDVSIDPKERMEAVDKIIEKENKLAKIKADVAADELKANLLVAGSRT